MHIIQRTALLALFLSLIATPLYAQEEGGKLKEFGKEVKTGEDNSADEVPEEQDEDDDELDPFWIDLIGNVISALVEGSLDTTNADEAHAVDAGPDIYHTYSDYPYFESDQGLYRIGGDKDFSFELKAHYHIESADLMGGGLRAKISPYRFFSGEAYITLLNESYRSVHPVTHVERRVNDNLMLASFFINYHLVRESYVAMWVGIGDKLIRGTAKDDGIAGNVALEVYPFDPVSFHIDVSAGPYTEIFTTANLHFSRFTVYAGYHGFDAGYSELNGLVAGGSFIF